MAAPGQCSGISVETGGIGDDNTGRIRTPFITYALIALNVLVFVFLQGMGTNERFTYAFSTVPQEIRTGEDVAREVAVELRDEKGTIPLQPTTGSVYLTLPTSSPRSSLRTTHSSPASVPRARSRG